LQCLNCQSVDDYDSSLFACLEDVKQAIDSSLKIKTDKFTILWYNVGLVFGEGGPFSGVCFPVEFRQCVEKMLKHEARSSQASIGAWEAEVLGLPSDLVLAVARSYARPFNPKQTDTLNEPDEGRFRIVYVSADLGEHPTTHLMSAELTEMSKSPLAEVFVLCIAKPDRLETLRSSSSLRRKELMRCFGERFLPVGERTDEEITREINKIRPQVIYLAGYHQDGDRPGVFRGVAGALIVQGVAHASTTGSKSVRFLLCNEQVLPEEFRKFFSEKPLYIPAPFLPNSFKEWFGSEVDWLSQLRNDESIRRQEREDRRMPHAKIIANIAKPNRLDKNFFDMAFAILQANAEAVLVLIDHGYPAFKKRTEARFENRGLVNRIVFMPFQELENGELHRVLALIDVYLDTPAYNGHTACHDALWANGVLVTVRGKSLAARVGADLLHHFGTPENICDDAASAVARVSELLQGPTCL